MNPSSNLKRLKVAATRMPADLADWLLEGIAQWETGNANTLDKGLGLCQSGKQSVPYRTKVEQRKAHLSAALDHVEERCTRPGETKRDWPRYEALAKAIRRYQTRGHAAGYRKRGDLHQCIVDADSVGIGLPTTAPGIYAALRKPTND